MINGWDTGGLVMAGGSLTKCGVCGKLKIYGQECARCKESGVEHIIKGDRVWVQDRETKEVYSSYPKE
jgi:hypothetical protein